MQIFKLIPVTIVGIGAIIIFEAIAGPLVIFGIVYMVVRLAGFTAYESVTSPKDDIRA